MLAATVHNEVVRFRFDAKKWRELRPEFAIMRHRIADSVPANTRDLGDVSLGKRSLLSIGCLSGREQKSKNAALQHLRRIRHKGCVQTLVSSASDDANEFDAVAFG